MQAPTDRQHNMRRCGDSSAIRVDRSAAGERKPASGEPQGIVAIGKSVARPVRPFRLDTPVADNLARAPGAHGPVVREQVGGMRQADEVPIRPVRISFF